ncbi:MAG: S16 family serine protease [Candidatus Bathyarchaeia archaeon]
MGSLPGSGSKGLLTASLILNVVLASCLVYVTWDYSNVKAQVGVLMLRNENLTTSLRSLSKELDVLRSQSLYYKSQAEYYSNLLRSGRAEAGVVGRSSVPLVAVRQRPVGPFEFVYEGVVMHIDVELKQGEGRILINTQPRIGIDLQTSARTAVLVAENLTGRPLSATDVILTVRGKEEVEVVDGPSAGAAITVAIMAAIRGQALRGGVFMTGTINPDGRVGMVGGVPEKALAAAKEGAELFLVPRGQGKFIDYRPVKRQPLPGFVIITYEPHEVDLGDFLVKNGYGTRVVEVADVIQAYGIFAKG